MSTPNTVRPGAAAPPEDSPEDSPDDSKVFAYEGWRRSRRRILDPSVALPATFVLLGPSGSGKTLFLAALRRRFARRGVRVHDLRDTQPPPIAVPDVLLIDDADHIDPAELAARLMQFACRHILTARPAFAQSPPRWPFPAHFVALEPMAPAEIRLFLSRRVIKSRLGVTDAPEAVLQGLERRTDLYPGVLIQELAHRADAPASKAAAISDKSAAQAETQRAAVSADLAPVLPAIREILDQPADAGVQPASETTFPPQTRFLRPGSRGPSALDTLFAEPRPTSRGRLTTYARRALAAALATMAALAVAILLPQRLAPPPSPMAALSPLPPVRLGQAPPLPRIAALSPPPPRAFTASPRPDPIPTLAWSAGAFRGPGLVLIAQPGDTLPLLYQKLYRGVRAPPYDEVTAANRAPIRPGSVLVFPEPASGWHAR